jgi:hypothetical protein
MAATWPLAVANTDAVFGSKCNDFHRIVVLWRRVSYEDKYEWAHREVRLAWVDATLSTVVRN